MLNKEQRAIPQERVNIFFVNGNQKFKIIWQSHVNDLLKYSYTKL